MICKAIGSLTSLEVWVAAPPLKPKLGVFLMASVWLGSITFKCLKWSVILLPSFNVNSDKHGGEGTSSIISEIRHLMLEEWIVRLKHTFREGNICADWLAT